MKGTVLKIDRGSKHDGPGIRTVVFLKGCPLRCMWCSTPDSQELKPQLLHVLYVVGMVEEGDGHIEFLKAFNQHTFVIHIGKADRPYDFSKSVFLAPIGNFFKQRF